MKTFPCDNSLVKVEIEVCGEDVMNLESLFDKCLKDTERFEIELYTLRDIIRRIKK